MNLIKIIASSMLAFTLLTPTAQASTVNYHQHLSAAAVARNSQSNRAITKSWSVRKLTTQQKYLLKHAYTYTTVVYPHGVTPYRRVAPWEGQHTLQPDADGNLTYYINPNNLPVINQTYQKAITAWNNLGVIHLVPTSDYQTADVILNDNHDLLSANPTELPVSAQNAKNWIGITYLNDSPNNSHNIIMVDTHTYTHRPDKTLNLSTAEHEIGHSLGFAHDPYTATEYATTNSFAYRHHRFFQYINSNEINTQQPIMTPDADGTPDSSLKAIHLGQPEINALKQHYNK